MTTRETTLQRAEEIANGTMAFHFEKPAGFTFKPGQAIDIVLLGPPGFNAQGTRHTFSIVSAPSENGLVIATRMRDSVFKQRLKALPLGAHAAIEGPFGSLTLHKDLSRPAVFIAGGIGITPFMSMLRQATNDRSPQRLLLFYSNRRPQDSAFLEELRQLERHSETFQLLATMTDLSDLRCPWDGRTGVIDGPLIMSGVAGLPAPIYYVAGPPGLVQAMRQTLNEAGIDDEDIRSEDFYGY